jgi:hypothetical protein
LRRSTASLSAQLCTAMSWTAAGPTRGRGRGGMSHTCPPSTSAPPSPASKTASAPRFPNLEIYHETVPRARATNNIPLVIGEWPPSARPAVTDRRAPSPDLPVPNSLAQRRPQAQPPATALLLLRSQAQQRARLHWRLRRLGLERAGRRWRVAAAAWSCGGSRTG